MGTVNLHRVFKAFNIGTFTYSYLKYLLSVLTKGKEAAIHSIIIKKTNSLRLLPFSISEAHSFVISNRFASNIASAKSLIWLKILNIYYIKSHTFFLHDKKVHTNIKIHTVSNKYNIFCIFFKSPYLIYFQWNINEFL